MHADKRHTFQKAYRETLKPPRFIIKAAQSTAHKAGNVINSTHKKLELQKLSKYHRDINHSNSDSEHFNSNTSSSNNTDNSSEPSRHADTFSSATTSSSIVSFSYDGILPHNTEPVPKPTCRLGDVQAEWEGGDIGWQLISLDSAVKLDPDSMPNDLPSLKRMNENLKQEQELLKTKLEILIASVTEQTALVSVYEEKLTKMRAKLNHQQLTNPMGDILTSIFQMPHPIPAREEWIQKSQRRMEVNDLRLREEVKSTLTRGCDSPSYHEEDEYNDESLSMLTTKTSDEQDSTNSSQTMTASSVTTTLNTLGEGVERTNSTMTATTTKTKTVQFAD